MVDISFYFSLVFFIGIEKYIDVYKIRYHKFLLRNYIIILFEFPQSRSTLKKS